MAYHEQEFENMWELEDWLNDNTDFIDVVAAFDTPDGAMLKYYNRSEDQVRSKPKEKVNNKDEGMCYVVMRNTLQFAQYIGKGRRYVTIPRDAALFSRSKAESMVIRLNRNSKTGGGWRAFKIK